MQIDKKTHQPCNDCGSKDALMYNEDGSSYCFSCNTFKGNKQFKGEVVNIEEVKKTELKYDFTSGYGTIIDRGISRETCEAYKCIKDNDNIAFGYTDSSGEVIAYKLRTKDKDFKALEIGRTLSCLVSISLVKVQKVGRLLPYAKESLMQWQHIRC